MTSTKLTRPFYLFNWNNNFFIQAKDTYGVSIFNSGVENMNVVIDTNESPPPTETSIPYWTFIGFRYILVNGMTGDNPKVELLRPTYELPKPIQYFTLPKGRHEFLTPLPFGIGRGLRIKITETSSLKFIFSSFSLEGTQFPQRRGTR